MRFLGNEMLATLAFFHVALAVGDEQYTKKARVASNKRRQNTGRLVFVMVGIISARIFVMGCSLFLSWNDSTREPVCFHQIYVSYVRTGYEQGGGTVCTQLVAH
jgi:hypothetical protein